MTVLGFYLIYVIAGFGTVALCDTLFELQDGPSPPGWMWFVVALIWPTVLFLIGVYVISHGLRNARL
jgi:hypothetical protein